MKKKTQVIIIHGGMTFRSEKDYLQYLKTREISLEKKPYWTDAYLTKSLGSNFEIIRPRMPLSDNARYRDWKIAFERYIPLMEDGVILIGVSLGGVFLAKYLSENKLPIKILSTYLVCPPFDNSLSGEDLVGGFTLPSKLALLDVSSKYLHLMFSLDDDVVPIYHAERYQSKLKNAEFSIYKSKGGHFRISKFPEIVGMIQKEVRGRK
jgi:predicted alpha/beta hydrolase family esterase